MFNQGMKEKVILGFTGTREGMTPAQMITFASLMNNIDIVEFHHGDCVGADTEASTLMKDVRRVIHPPTDSRLRAFCTGDEIRPTRPYFDRNRDIVDESDVLIATPKESSEQQKGGTWYTIRYGRRSINTTVVVIYPDGHIEVTPSNYC